ncbi:MAG: hypothetical protein AAGD35_19880, partial [Actinomycetota bacterium]
MAFGRLFGALVCALGLLGSALVATPSAGAVGSDAGGTGALGPTVSVATGAGTAAVVGWGDAFGPGGLQIGFQNGRSFDPGSLKLPVEPDNLAVGSGEAAAEDRAIRPPAEWFTAEPAEDEDYHPAIPVLAPLAPSTVATFEPAGAQPTPRAATVGGDADAPEAGPRADRSMSAADTDGDAPMLDGKIRLDRPAADAGAEVEMATLDSAATAAMSSAGLAFELSSSVVPSDWALELDLSLFDGVADPSALRLVVRTGCDADGACSGREVLATEIDREAGVLRATLTGGAVTPPNRRSTTDGSDDGSDDSAGDGATRTPRAAQADAPALAPVPPVALAVEVGPQGANGDFTATPFNALAPWQVGPQTGHAEVSYPIAVPPAPGHVPDLSLQYSSGLVDAMNGAANTQVSRVGAGWSEPGRALISRELTECDDGRLCAAHGRHDGFNVQFGGVSAPLIRVTASEAGVPHPQYAGGPATRMWEYRLQTQNDWRIRRVEQPSAVSGASNGDAWGTWWEITTGDGTLWVFGRERVFDPVADGGPATLWQRNAAHAAPLLYSTQSVYMPFDAGDRTGAGSGDGGCVAGTDMCLAAMSWNLDQVIDTDGNHAVYHYENVLNRFVPDGLSQAFRYDREVRLTVIQYGLRYGAAPLAGNAAAPYRVKLDYQDRIDGATWHDTPNFDCDAAGAVATTWSGNCQASPTFYTTKRLSKITTITDNRGVDRKGNRLSNFVRSWVLTHSWPTDGSGSPRVMWLDQIRAFGGNEVTASALPATTFEHEQSAWPGVAGWAKERFLDSRVTGSDASPFAVPRLRRMVNEVGADVRFFYGQTAAPNANATNCGAASGGVVVRPTCDAYQDSPGGDWWNKYKVDRMVVSPTDGGSQVMASAYDYGGAPDWGYRSIDDKAGAASDEGVWSDYRGHREVTVEVRYDDDPVSGGQGVVESTTSHYFFTGMWDDRFGVDDDATLGGKRPGAAPAVAADSRGKNVPNRQILAGESLGTVARRGNGVVAGRRGDIQGRDINEFRVNDGITVDNDALPDRYTKTYVLAGTTSYSEIYNAPKPGNDTGGWALRTRVDRAFDAKGRLTTEVDYGRYQANGAGAVVDNGDDRTTVITYDEQTTPWIVSNPSSTVVREGRSATVGTVVGETRATYDAKGRVLQARTRRSNASDDDFADVDYTYNNRGQVLTAIARGDKKAADDQTTTYTYNARFGYLSGVDGPIEGAVDTSTFVVDPGHNVVISSTDADGRVTSYTYDLLGRRTGVYLPGAPVDVPSYRFAYGTARSEVDWIRTEELRQGRTEYVKNWEFFDGLGRSIQTQGEHPTDTTKTQVLSMRYDNMGRLWQETDPTYRPRTAGPAGVAYFREFDPVRDGAANRLDFVPNAAHREYYYPTNARRSGVGQASYDETFIDQGCLNGHTTRIAFFGADRKQWAHAASTACGLESRGWDRDGKRSLTVSDVRGNVTRTVDPAGGTTTFAYNVRDELTTSTSPAGATTSYNYSKWRIFGPTKITNPDSGTSTFKYDGHGRLKQQKDGAGRKLNFVYDNGNRPTKVKVKGKTATAWTYDPPNGQGQVASIEHFNVDVAGLSTGKVTTSYTYDNRGRVASMTQSVPGAPGGPKAFSYSYFENSQLASITYPGGVKVDRTYDRTARPATLTVTDGPSVRPVVRSVAYNGRGLLNNLIRGAEGSPESLDTRYRYEPASGRLWKATSTGAAGTVLDYHYAYSDAGLLRSSTETSPAGGSQQCFVYDGVNRLTDAWTQAPAFDANSQPQCAANRNTDRKGPEPYDVAYAFDADGRITRATGAGTANGAYTYSAAVPFHAADKAGSTSFTYDKGGSRVISAPASAGATTYVYDAHARLLSTAGAVVSSMLYDHSGERVRRTVPGDVDFYFAHGYELDSDGEWRITLGFGGQTVATYQRGRVLWTQAADPLGTSNYSVSSGGEETYRRFLPFGSPRSASSDPVVGGPSDLGFTGQRHDDALDLLYYGARYYDPVVG